MPVRVSLAAENGSGCRFGDSVASDYVNASNYPHENGLLHHYKGEIWSRNDALMNFAAARPARWLGNTPEPSGMSRMGYPSADSNAANFRVSRNSHELKQMYNATIRAPVQDPRVPERFSVIPGKQDQRSRSSWSESSQETLLYPDDLAHNELSADGEDSEGKSTDAGDDLHEQIYQEYLVEGAGNKLEEAGITLMLRDIPYRMQVEPHLFDLLQSTSDLRHVDYIYLPQSIKGHSDAVNMRNKGYCFIHFSNKASAQLFISRLEDYVLPDSIFQPGNMSATRAKFQGLSLNLHSLLDIHAKKWRPRDGHVYIRRAGGELTSFGLLRLRNLLKKHIASRSNDKRLYKLITRRTSGKE